MDFKELAAKYSEFVQERPSLFASEDLVAASRIATSAYSSASGRVCR